MRYIIRKDSEVGKKVAKIVEKMLEARQAQLAMAEKYGFTTWKANGFAITGGITCVNFETDTTPDAKLWAYKKSVEMYFPNFRTKAGKELAMEFQKMPEVLGDGLHKAIGFSEDWFEFRPGLSYPETGDYFGIKMREDWEYKPPKDVVEVTTQEYEQLFPSSKKTAK